MTQTKQRQQALAPLSCGSSQAEPWDMLIIGGGITGAGIAREAARRGLKVLLIEQKDFAWGTPRVIIKPPYLACASVSVCSEKQAAL